MILILDTERYFTADDYPRMSFPLMDCHELNERADTIRKQKGLMPMFDFEHEHDDQGWYDFSVECELKDLDANDIQLWFRVENGKSDDNQQSYRIKLTDAEIQEVHDWLLKNEETGRFIRESFEFKEGEEI